ncbi:hypothetical protein ACQY0O_007246 [Thecaphora frezii]
MAWRSSGATNEELVSNLVHHGLLTSPRLAGAMASVDRAHYVPDTASAYLDSPQTIGYGATISAPHMHAHAFENLAAFLQPGNRVLDVGSGSGYCVAVFHRLVSPGASTAASGKVVGIDHIQELVDQSRTNLVKDGFGAALSSGNVELVKGDGREGWEPEAPYDVIHVGAAAPKMPQPLIDQLKAPGRMFIPVNSSDGYGQDVWQVDKDAQSIVTKTKLFEVNYVPLTDEHKQRR